MRIIRLLSLAMLPMLAPLARAAAQTCQGTAEFRDGRARVDVDYQHASDLDHVQEGFTYGAQGSWYGGVTANQTARGGGGPDMNGFGGNVGYQIHWVDTPFQVCPMPGVRVGERREHHDRALRREPRLSCRGPAGIPPRAGGGNPVGFSEHLRGRRHHLGCRNLPELRHGVPPRVVVRARRAVSVAVERLDAVDVRAQLQLGPVTQSISIAAGSSISSFRRTRNSTACCPSMMRWS
jgi:hypothetical protein